ncbi:hypothetical protein KKF32_02800 [Patescibacteria group bacterium]|nr:hypothetical protein [Patescibacteria group bacterium]
MLSETLKKIFYYTIRILTILIFISAVIGQNWGNALVILIIFILTYIPTWLRIKHRLYLPLELDLVVIGFIFFTLFLGEINHYYYKFWWWDVFLHIEAGFLCGILGFIFIYSINNRYKGRLYMNPSFVALFAFTFSLAVGGVLWEILEFILDSLFNLGMQENSLTDTMGDLITDTIGALLVAIVGYLWMRKKLRSTFVGGFISRFISRFVKRNRHLFRKVKE